MKKVAGTGRWNEGPGIGWSVFDGVKTSPFPPRKPETLMSEIDAAIAASEYARATAALPSVPPPAAEKGEASAPMDAILEWEEEVDGAMSPLYDKRIADEAYKAACSALAAGRPDAAIRSLHVAIASCPPDKTSALNKLRSLLAIASSEQQKQHQHQKIHL